MPEFHPTKSSLVRLGLRRCPSLTPLPNEQRSGQREFCVNHTDGDEEPRPTFTSSLTGAAVPPLRGAAEWQLPCLLVIQHLEETANAAPGDLRIISSCRGKIQQMELGWEKLLKVKTGFNLICICAFVEVSAKLRQRGREKRLVVC